MPVTNPQPINPHELARWKPDENQKEAIDEYIQRAMAYLKWCVKAARKYPLGSGPEAYPAHVWEEAEAQRKPLDAQRKKLEGLGIWNFTLIENTYLGSKAALL